MLGRFIIIGLVGIGMVGIVTLMVISQGEPERANTAPRPVSAFVEEARREAVSLTVHSQGEARPRTQINLVPQVAGRITFVNPNFIEGGFFQAGETLIQIDEADYRLAVTRAAAQVAQAEQGLLREQAESDLAASEWEVLGEGEASALTLRAPQMAEARAQLAAANATLQSARLDLGRTRVSAPFTGRVRAKSADLGQYVSPGTQLGTVFSTDRVLVRLPLTDNDLGLLGIPVAYNPDGSETGIPVTLTATLAGSPRHWNGFITRTDSAIDAQTRVLYAIAEVEDPYGAAADAGAPLPVGLFVSAEIRGRSIEDAFVLPRSALRGADTVYVVQPGGILEVRTVEVITSNADRLLVSSGVAAGEMVVISPLRGANAGMRIQSLDAAGSPIEAYSAQIEESDDDDDASDASNNTDAIASAE